MILNSVDVAQAKKSEIYNKEGHRVEICLIMPHIINNS